MIGIEYRVQYTGATGKSAGGRFTADGTREPEYELIWIKARNINSGYSKALALALEPLGNGIRREIGAIEFSRVL